ncbi:hypothetical protein NX794_02300 [Streptomyces sp. LP11]|uniref:Uncharacterized protein n=1 Tax=Streptomyces pyxinicus TaxID=2970331 RepID=A0ABT2AUY6_9ACTN|nr:hypothetical protein [Streptomyces sp. LP11]MCS0600072.1 hypothetical protein [Streptomyces sp. LP11]
MARTEYYEEPNAAKPESMAIVASTVVADDDHGRILRFFGR